MAGGTIERVVIDLDATLVEVYSDEQDAAPHYKGGFRYHPLLAYLDNTGRRWLEGSVALSDQPTPDVLHPVTQKPSGGP